MSIKFINKSGGKSKLPNGTKFYSSSFSSFDLNDFDISELTDLNSFFYLCTSLTTIDLSNMDFSNITSMNSLFNGCTSLTSANLSNIKTHNTVSFNQMFSSCTNLTTIDFSNTSKHYVNNMGNAFKNCTSLTSLDLSNIDTTSCDSIGNLFSGCTNLVNVDISHFNLEEGSNFVAQNCVQNCPNLSNESMNSVLKALSTARITNSTYRKLSRCGFTQEQAEICTTLSNWPALEALGWDTGY